MPSKDFINNHKTAVALTPAVVTADALGAEVDMKGYNSLTFMFDVGDSGDTLSGSVYIECEIQHADTSGGSYAACADADVRDPVTGTNTGTVSVINAPTEDQVVVVAQYIGNKQFVKANLNVTGTHTNGTPMGIISILGDPQIKPAA